MQWRRGDIGNTGVDLGGGEGLGSARVKCTPGDTNALPKRLYTVLVYMLKCTPIGIGKFVGMVCYAYIV